MKPKQVLGKGILQLTQSSHLNELFLCQGRILFCTFVDYSKAFNSISRATLWKKSLSYGITGKVIDVIMNMYKSIKSCVMDSGIQSDFFNHM